jgi:hypothetical protein
MQNVSYCHPTLIKVGMCKQVLVKLLSIEFHDNLFSVSPDVNEDRRTDVVKLVGKI